MKSESVGNSAGTGAELPKTPHGTLMSITTGEPDKLRICCHLSKSTKLVPSVNLFIPKHDFPTRFDTVSRVADMVSFLSSSRVLKDTWCWM